MGSRRNTILGLITLGLFVGIGLAAHADAQVSEHTNTETSIDAPGFLALSEDVLAYRKSRLVTLEQFNAMKDQPETMILDTRSREAFDEGHIEGAVHLNFSDFTDEKLAKTIPSKTTRILIYCNNNFTDNIQPIMVKRVELALNVPTFINLYGYGYENIYELGDQVSMLEPDVHWVGSHITE